MDWSTNLAIKQSRAVQGHFFFNKQLSLHPMVLWHQGGSSSICTFSDSICHKAAATWAGISGLLYEILREGYMKIVFISDSPTKQYRNRYIASLLEHLVDTYPEEITRVWTWKGSSRWCWCHCKEQVEKDNCKRRQRRFLCRGTEEKLSGRRPKCSGHNLQ